MSLKKNGGPIKRAQAYLSTTCPAPFTPPGKHKFKCLAILKGENTSGKELDAVARLTLSRLDAQIDAKEIGLHLPQGEFNSVSIPHTFELELDAGSGQTTVVIKVQFWLKEDTSREFAANWRVCDFRVE